VLIILNLTHSNGNIGKQESNESLRNLCLTEFPTDFLVVLRKSDLAYLEFSSSIK
jgi:hypothetical protein